MNIAYSAFDQFEIIRLIPLHLFGNFDISITNSTVFLLVAVGSFYWLYLLNVEEGPLVPGRWQSIIELAYENMLNVVKDNIGSKGFQYFPFIFTLFIFLAMLNLFGIVPYTFSPTSHIAITFGLSLSIFLGVTLLGLVNYQSNYLSMFMPGGAPMIMAPFLVVIEIISHVAKAISLGVRLAANITAGHLLFAILSGFCWTMLTAGGMLALLSTFPILIVVFITGLEMAVALIQAYVFSLLTSIYISESIDLH
jgi:ATP synthase subunit 6